MLTKPIDFTHEPPLKSPFKVPPKSMTKELTPLTLNFFDSKPPTFEGRPQTTHLAGHKNPDSGFSSALNSPKSHRIQQQAKPSTLTKDHFPSNDKTHFSMNVLKFQQFVSPKQYSETMQAITSTKKRAIGSSSHRGFGQVDPQPQEGGPQNELGFNEYLMKSQGFQLPKSEFSRALGSKKSSMNDLSPGALKNLGFVNNEKLEDNQLNMVRSLEPEYFGKNMNVRRKPDLTLVSPRTVVRKIVNPMTAPNKAKRFREDGVKFQQEDEVAEGDFKKTKDQPMSQAMFRMREFKRVKDFLLKRNSKMSTNFATENTGGKSFTVRQTEIKLPNEALSVKGKKNELIENQLLLKEEKSEKTAQRSASKEPKNYEQIDAETNTDLTKGNEKEIVSMQDSEKKDTRPKFIREHIQLREDFVPYNSLKRMSQGTPSYPLSPFDFLDRRKSDGIPHRVDKFDIKKFLKSINKTPRDPSIVIQKEDCDSKKLEEETKEPQTLEIPISKPSINHESPVSAKEIKIKQKQQQQQQQQTTKTQPNGSVNKIKTILKQMPQKGQGESPRSKKIEKVEKAEKPIRKFQKKDTQKEEGNKLKKKFDANQMVGLDELSKISIKQFEISESWDYDNFELMKKSLKELK